MIGLTRALSEDFISKPITFNALCPADIDTPVVERNTSSFSQRAGISETDACNMMVQTNRHKRLIALSEIAAAALRLCGPGSESVNGQSIEIAGRML